MKDPRQTSYWEQGLRLQSSPPLPLPEQVDVLIVGAGFMGRWLAWFLGKLPSGPRVLVVERDAFTYGASSRNAGFLTCGQVSEMVADVESNGMDAVVDTFMRRRRGIDVVQREFPRFELERCGSTDFDPLTDRLRDLADALNGVAGETIYHERTARLANTVRPAIFNSADAGLHPVSLLRLLHKGANASFHFGVDAEHVSGGVARLWTTEGPSEVRYGASFICTNSLAPELQSNSRVRPGRGQIILTSPVRTETDRTLGYLNRGYDYFRFLGDRLLIGGGRHRFAGENGPTELAPSEELRKYLVEVARQVIGHGDFHVEHHWAGIMGFQAGRHLGGSPRARVDDTTEVVAGFGGMGVALTPVVADEIAAEFR